jgi:hypothetical protein
VVITAAAKNDAETTADARRDYRPFEDKVKFRYLVGLPMADLRQEVSRLSEGTIIIYLSIFQDGADKLFIPRDALVQVAQAASIPIYGYYDSYRGHGMVGRFVGSFEIEAANAARLGLRILDGEKPQEMSTAGHALRLHVRLASAQALGNQRRESPARQRAPLQRPKFLGPLPVADNRSRLILRHLDLIHCVKLVQYSAGLKPIPARFVRFLSIHFKAL